MTAVVARRLMERTCSPRRQQGGNRLRAHGLRQSRCRRVRRVCGHFGNDHGRGYSRPTWPGVSVHRHEGRLKQVGDVKVVSGIVTGDDFGVSAAISGATAVVGAPYTPNKQAGIHVRILTPA